MIKINKLKKKFCIILIVFISLIFISVLFVSSVSGNERPNKKINGKTDKIVYEKFEEKNTVNIIIKLKSDEDIFLSSKRAPKDSFIEDLEENKEVRKYKDFIFTKVSKKELRDLERNSDIEYISYLPQFRASLQDSVPLMNINDSWEIQISGQNITGTDETICIIDSGANFSHPDLIGRNQTCVVDCFNKTCVENCSMGDDEGHGTHVAGIAAAYGGINGVAINSSLIAIKVLNSSGDAHEISGVADITNAIDWCISNRETYNISVISMSLGSDTLYNSYCDSSFTTFRDSINNATFFNISVIAATGNDASSTSISSPACINNATAVSATDKSDNIATAYANRNSITDLVATGGTSGNKINSTQNTGGYVGGYGTSMATPHVAGAFALITHFYKLENNRTLTPSEILNALSSTGEQIYDAASARNYSRINVYSALEELGYNSSHKATIGFMSDGRPYDVADGSSQLQKDLNVSNNLVVIGSDRNLDAMVFVGDMDYINYSSGRNTEEAYAGSKVKDISRFYVLGNHELDNTYDVPVIREFFSSYNYTPNQGPLGSENTTYSFDKGDLHIVIINPYWDGDNDNNCQWYASSAGDDDDTCNKYSTSDGGYIVDELFDWLKYDLRNSTKPYKIVTSHEPAYPLYRHEGDSLDANITNRDKFWNLLKTEKVIAHITAHTHRYVFNEYDGVFEVNAGVCGRMVGLSTYDDYATIIYAHVDINGNFEIRAAREEPNWNSPNISVYTRDDITNQTLVNTWAGAGSVSRYFIDKNNSDESNPNWSSYNDSQWWALGFDDNATNWTDGELGTGYDSENFNSWGWINKNISVGNGIYGIFQRINFTTYSKDIYNKMMLGIDYDDSIIVWLNGIQIYKSDYAPNISSGDIWDKNASSENNSLGDESYAPNYTYIDVSKYINNLKNGENLIAIGNWNVNLSSTDLISAVNLVIQNTGLLEVNINSPITKTYSTPSILFNASLGGPGYCEYTLNEGSTNNTMSSSDNITWTDSQSLSDGSYIVRFYCNNSQGDNNYTETVSFSVSTYSSNSPGGGTSATYLTYIPSAEELLKGYVEQLKEEDRIKFTMNNETHFLILNYIGEDWINVTIQSEPIDLILWVGEEKKLNLTSQDYYDIYIKLNSIENNEANITFKNINEEIPKQTPIIIIGDENKSENKSEPPAKSDSSPKTPIFEIVFYIIAGSITLLLVILILIKLYENTKLSKEIRNKKNKKRDWVIKEYKEKFDKEVRPKDYK